MSDLKKSLWEALREVGEIQEDIELQYDEEATVLWDTLSVDKQMLLFYYVIKQVADAELKDDFETYRHILHERFGFPSESYHIGLMAGFMQLHNSIIRPSEQSAYREFYYEKAKEDAKKRTDH